MNGSGAAGWMAGVFMVLAASIASPTDASAGLFGQRNPPKAQADVATSPVAEIRRAIGEQRLLDAGKMLDRALISGDTSPQLVQLGGELALAQGRYDDALATYKRLETDPALKGDALEGEGVALSLLGRSDEALTVLKQAVAAKPTAWRAWNALASEYDSRRDWPAANAAYERAITESNRAAIALNNRGYSRMLQGSLDGAVSDLVEALGKRPDFAEARTNLRLAMAMRGEYDRAMAGAPHESEAATLNNAGFAAMLRGDYGNAESLFERAMQAKGEYYSRAAANLQLARSLKAHTDSKAPRGADAP